MKRTIAILSGKGGVGKTFLTAALSLTLAGMGKRVLAADLDMGLRNLDIPLGMTGRLGGSLWSLARGLRTEKDVLLPVCENLDFLPASVSADWSRVSKGALRDVFQDFRGRYDYVFLDCPAGNGKGIRFAESLAEEILLVAAPSRASLQDVPKLYGALGGEEKCGVICNGFSGGARDAVPFSAAVEALSGLRVLGVLPYSEAADRAAQEGTLASAAAGAFGKALRLLAETILEGTAVSMELSKKLLSAAAAENGAVSRGPFGAERARRLAARWKWKGR